MNKKFAAYLCLALVACLMLASVSCAAEGQTAGQKAKTFWQKLFNYPANVTKESADVIADTGKRGTEVVTKEVKKVGEVTSGDIQKTGDLVTEPVKGIAETVKSTVEGTANIPAEAAKEEPKPAESK